jgi:glutamate dehydrogenase
MESHPLRREIIATHLTNDIVNRMGAIFYIHMQERTGARTADIARAYTAACEIFDARALWASIEALDNQVAAAIQLDMMAAVNRLLDRAAVWLLRNRRQPLDIAATREYFAADVERVRSRMPRLLRDDARDLVNTREKHLQDAGVPDELAQHAACLDILFAALNVIVVARNTDVEIESATDVYFELGFALALDWLHQRIQALPALDHWDRGARAMLRDELNGELRVLAAEVLRSTDGVKSSQERVQAWLEQKHSAVAHYLSVIADLKSSGKTDLAMLTVAVREVRSLVLKGAVAGTVDPLGQCCV